jgi:uncharacterized protein YutE (UPF0331/DUF86 family)
MIDKNLVNRKIVLISKDFEEIKRLSEMTYSDFISNPINEVLAERYLERVIGRMIDINYHLITEMGMPPPSDYFQSFTELSKLKVYPQEFGKKIAKCAGLRNRIVHEYDSIDPKKIYEGLKFAKEDIPKYLNYVNEFLKMKHE